MKTNNMKPLPTRIRVLAILFFFSVSLYSIQAQPIVNSRNSSFYTFIYKLSNRQAKQIYQKGMDKPDDNLFSSCIDSFPTDKPYIKKLPVGHYLYVKSIENKLQLEVKSVNNLSILSLNNRVDLCLMVHDSLGNTVKDAIVHLGRKQIPFDTKTNTYFLKGNNRKGFLEVEYMGQTAYYTIVRQNNNPPIKLVLNKVLYQSPAKYIVVPVTCTIMFPYDLYKYARYGYRAGGVYWITQPFVTVYRSITYGSYGFVKKIECFFNRHKCESFKSAVFCSQPRYKPGDTVRFQAFIFDNKNRLVTDSMKVELNTNQIKLLGYCKAKQPGIYVFEFKLKPELELTLNRGYSVSLTNPYDNTAASAYFRYEDYELKSTNFYLRKDKETYKTYQPVTLYAKGEDENELIIPDARVELTMFSVSQSNYEKKRDFVPDTLWQYTQNLDPLGETKIVIPDSVFPKANAKVRVEAKFRTSSNEWQDRSVSFERNNDPRELKVFMQNDSVVFEYAEKGKSKTCEAEIEEDNAPRKAVTLPFKIKLNPLCEDYYVYTNDMIESLSLEDEQDGVNCITFRDKDSVKISIQNPHKLNLVYFVYKKDHCIYRGTENTPVFKCRNTTKENYFVSMHYLWASKIKSNEYKIPFRDKELSVKVIEPSVIYPEQRVRINVAVTNATGTPVSNASVLAYGYTKKFPENPSGSLPYFGKSYSNRKGYNSFSLDTDFDENQNAKLYLDWQAWRNKLGLDSIELYKFLYPQEGFYQTSFKTRDTITQVAPFLVKNGQLAPINIVYIDDRPVYSDLTTSKQAYSFPASPGKHKIRLRTFLNEIILDSVYLEKGCKTIFSADVNSTCKRFTKEPRHFTYTWDEMYLLNNDLIKISGDLNNRAYLNQKNHYELLEPHVNSYGSIVAGPFPDGFVIFKSQGNFLHSFIRESEYEYQFFPGYYKMKCSVPLVTNKTSTSFEVPSRDFNELVYTSASIAENWNNTVKYFQTNLNSFTNPYNTLKGNGTLELNYIAPVNKDKNLDIKNIIITSYTDTSSIRIYQGNQRKMFDFKQGYYKLIAILQDNRYFVEDSVYIRPNGKNYIRLENEKILDTDSRIDVIDAIIRARVLHSNTNNLQNEYQKTENDKKQISVIMQNQTQNCTDGHFICGTVTDDKGETLPGVSIIIKGTTKGTISDINGKFCICIPYKPVNLFFSYIGYKSQELNDKQVENQYIVLKEEVNRLEEVVVIGYGVQRKTLVSGSVVSVQSSDVQSALSGNANGVPGAGNSIQIRGISSMVDNKTPLYVIDGIPYTGTELSLNADAIAGMSVLKDATATSLYGARGANGVILITTKKGINTGSKNFGNNQQNAQQKENPMRNNFSDMGFWKPAQLTDHNGIASFEVKFPDDLTSWKTFYYASGNQSTGQYQGEIKAFMPLSGTLAVPRFLIKGDQCNAIGKVTNYTSDTLALRTVFAVNEKKQKEVAHKILNSVLDTLSVKAETEDTLRISYQLSKDDGYTDGEKREIPVLPYGTKESVGQFFTLEKDTTLTISLNKEDGEASLVADAHPLSFVKDELKHIHNYSYLCNEQTASKLKALLCEKRIAKLMDKDFVYEKDIKKLIDKLESSRTGNNLWGWWPSSPSCIWISKHVIEALAEAKKEGYKVNVNFKDIFASLVYQFDNSGSRDKMRILKTFRMVDSTNNYIDYIKAINPSKFTFTERVEYLELLQLNGIKPRLDTLLKWKKETAFHNVYWGKEQISLFDDALYTTATVYRILKREGVYPELLPLIRNYMLERRGGMYWRNTYESMDILETILPDILVNKEIPKSPRLVTEGSLTIDTSGYPVRKKFKPDGSLTIHKHGEFPVYLTVWQNRWNANPVKIDKNFAVKSYFEQKDSVLKAGEAVTLVAEIEVKRSSDYVMIEIPIPAGCSYKETPEYQFGEAHREYFKEKVSVFCNHLAEGTYQYRIKLMPRYTGIYNLNPVRAELMYFPVMYGQNDMKKIIIR